MRETPDHRLHDGGRFARSRPGEDQKRPISMLDHLPLLGIELGGRQAGKRGEIQPRAHEP